MAVTYRPDSHIILPEDQRRTLLDHCQEALDAYHQGQARECKAFGLICGSIDGQVISVADCFRLRKNVRSQSPYKERMDQIMAEHAIPSKTSLDMRGWVADPAELFARIRECRERGQMLLGTYHMHWVGWEHDPVRDTPTILDAVLAKESGLLMFIVSMVEPARPIIRVFYEGVREQEVPVR